MDSGYILLEMMDIIQNIRNWKKKKGMMWDSLFFDLHKLRKLPISIKPWWQTNLRSKAL